MTRWLVILSDPPLQLHDAGGRAYIDPSIRSAEILSGVGALRSTVSGEVPGVTITLSNADGEAVPLLRRPPLLEPAVEYGRRDGATVELFRGVINRVTLNEQASIEVSA